jgi:acyl CoA:acetate/3-ketoacid CoA transferase beta subunit
VSTADQLVWTLAQEARPDDVIVVGVATPIASAAALLARELFHPELHIILAASVDPPSHDIARPMLDGGYVSRVAAGTLSQSEVLDAIQRGRITLQFVSPAEVDGAGRLNTSWVSGPDGAPRRLPGGLATGDISVLVGRLVAYRAAHSSRFLVPQVQYVTGAGHDRGAGWREAHALPGTGLRTIVTDRAVLRFDEERRAFRLSSVHPGSSVDEVVRDCGFTLLVDDDVATTEPPSERALELLDATIDPHGVRRLEVREERAEARAALASLRDASGQDDNG